MIKFSDFGKSQFRSAKEGSKFGLRIMDSENKNNIDTLEAKTLNLFQKKGKSERITILNAVDGVNQNKN